MSSTVADSISPRQNIPDGLLAKWPLVRLGVFFRHIDERSASGDERLLSITKLHGVVPRDQLTDRPPRADTLVGYKRCRAGDLIINQMSIFDGLLGISQWNGIVTYHYLVFRPSPDIDARYYGYLLRSTLYLHDFAKRVRGLGDAQQSNVRTPHIRIGDVGQTIVPFPVRHEQTAIADYLDDETTRIDGLIAKKRRMISVISTRRSILIEQAIRASVDRCGAMPLKHVAGRIEVGIVVTPSAWYADDGVLALRGMNVRPGELVLDEVVRISEEGHRLHRKSELRSGDVVVVRTGQAGAAAVVPPSLAGANCIDLVIIRSASKLLPEFLHFVLNSDWTQKHIEAHSVGTIQSHFNVGSMKDLPLPVPSLDEQRRVVELLTEASADHDRLMTALEKQISLLAEHRQALITAAVTGELRIPGVAA